MAKKKSGIVKKILIVLFLIFFMALLGVSAFAASIYFGVLDNEKVQWVNEKVGLYKLPFIGAGQDFEYFAVPEGVEWPPPPEPEPEPQPDPEPATEPVEPEKKPEPKREEKPKEVKVDRRAIEEQRAKREAEEKKRVARLAKIYESMKPEAAANALINVDWDTTVLILQRMSEDSVAQILSKMEPEAAAQLTEMIYTANQRRVTTPSDTMRDEPVTPPEEVAAE